MLAKKKPVPAMTRSRFTKAKPNIKIGPKTSQPSQQKEKIPDECTNEHPEVQEDIPLEEDKKQEVIEEVEEEAVDNLAWNNSSSEQQNSQQNQPTIQAQESNTIQISLSDGNISHMGCTGDADAVENNVSFLNKDSELPPQTPEKTVCSPMKTVLGSTNDKSQKYPCLTKILHGPKKRASNRELHERKKMMASFKDLPPRNKMTFTDLIYWNPRTSPMKPKTVKTTTVLFDPKENEPAEEEEEGTDVENGDSIAPKLLINENGEIVIDQSSLVVKRKKAPIDMTAGIINMDDDANFNYGSFRRKVSKSWSPKETVNFYKALSVVGTDFALMENIMKGRTRRELKTKFKKEEKMNMELLQRAMYDTDTFQTDFSIYELDLDDIDIPGLEEHIVQDSLDQKDKKAKQKMKDTSQSVPNGGGLKRGRGRPRKERLPLENNENENTMEMDSPITYRKRKARALPEEYVDNAESEDSDMCEIQVQINSLPETDSNASNVGGVVSPSAKKRCILTPEYEGSLQEIPSDYQKMEHFINPEESPTNTNVISSFVKKSCIIQLEDDSSVQEIPDDSLKMDNFMSTEESPTNTNGHSEIVENISKSGCDTQSANPSDVVELLPDVRVKSFKRNSVKNVTSDLANNPTSSAATYKRTRRLKVKPNVEKTMESAAKKKNSKCVTDEPGAVFLHADSRDPSSVIEVTDEQLLSDSVTDVVTTTETKAPRKYKNKSNLPIIKQEDIGSPMKRPQFSSLNYTPVLDSDETQPHQNRIRSLKQEDAVPVFSQSPAIKSYSLRKLESILKSEPVITPERACKSSPLVSAMNASATKSILIPMTPERSTEENSCNMGNVHLQDSEEGSNNGPTGLMFMTQSSAGDSLHFYIANHFSGGLPLPPEITAPPVCTMEFKGTEA